MRSIPNESDVILCFAYISLSPSEHRRAELRYGMCKSLRFACSRMGNKLNYGTLIQLKELIFSHKIDKKKQQNEPQRITKKQNKNKLLKHECVVCFMYRESLLRFDY